MLKEYFKDKKSMIKHDCHYPNYPSHNGIKHIIFMESGMVGYVRNRFNIINSD